MPEPLDSSRLLLSLAAALLFYLAFGAIRRVYFSPLSKFPGPKLAALTLWNEFYWDVVKRGSFMWRIQEMHEKYGSTRSRASHRVPRMRQLLTHLYRPYCAHQPVRAAHPRPGFLR